MPRRVKKVIENPMDTYGNDPGYEDPLENMTPEQIALLCDYCEYLNAHDGYDPDNYEEEILERENQLFGRGRTKSNAPPPLYPEEEEDDDDEEEEDEEEPEEEQIEEAEEEENESSSSDEDS